MSVFGAATFPYTAPDLWLTGDHYVGKLSAIRHPTRPTQPSSPWGRYMKRNAYIYMDYGVETIEIAD